VVPDATVVHWTTWARSQNPLDYPRWRTVG
jgi:hypothetical protein